MVQQNIHITTATDAVTKTDPPNNYVKFDTSLGKISIFIPEIASQLRAYVGKDVEVEWDTNASGYKEIKRVIGPATAPAAPAPTAQPSGTYGWSAEKQAFEENKQRIISRQACLNSAIALMNLVIQSNPNTPLTAEQARTEALRLAVHFEEMYVFANMPVPTEKVN